MEEVKGYHLTKIAKGEIGESSKLLEEIEELIDAEKQNCKIMILVELSDLYGAMELYLEHNFTGISMKDLSKMSKITRRAFETGARE